MPQQPVPNVARVVTSFQAGSEEWANIYHFQKAGFSAIELEALAVAVDAAFTALRMSTWSTQMTYLRTTAYSLASETAPVYSKNTNTRAGAAGTLLLPLNVACVITVRTASRGRSGRGRVYIGGLTESDVTNREIEVAAQTRCLELMDGVVNAGEAPGWTYGIVQRWQDHEELASPVFREGLSREIRNAKVASQRRRVDRP